MLADAWESRMRKRERGSEGGDVGACSIDLGLHMELGAECKKVQA